MQAEFWHQKWAHDDIGFHQPQINTFLQNYWPALEVEVGAQVLVPLCGKSKDMIWLLEQGYRVLGIELSDKALQEFISDNTFDDYAVIEQDDFSGYQTEYLRLLCGDFFKLSAEECHGVNAVYDRAALVALPAPMRKAYARHLAKILPQGCQWLLITMEYDEQLMEGPPFSVTEDEVGQLFADFCQVDLLHSHGFQRKGVAVVEKVYRLQKW